ncbi:type I-C CRISPR-associated protein Cas5c [Actinocatenispora rupis]|uniref:type I-C CRISPR-associated protein Cas5c n=1 Tax=Actinocatenispora rupis TaxID=519421 RepID=UPI003570E24C
MIDGQPLPAAGGHPPVVMQVWGEAALFTRPELKVERVTYPVPTPTAAVGILESVFWKPEMRYQVVAIEVLKPIRQFRIRRNETSDLPSLAEAARGARRVDTAAHRDQRNAVCLRDVAYRIHAHIHLQGHASKPVAAYRDQFRRRVTRGACFQRPYLGTREFAAYFGDPDDTPPINRSEQLGIMLHSIDRSASREPAMTWFTAQMTRGVVRIPEHGIPAGLPAVAGA